MANCNVCGGKGPMVAIHSGCLHDLLEFVREQQPVLCDLCASVELCQQEIERTKPGEPLHLACVHAFRLDMDKVQAALQEQEAVG